MPGSWDTDAVTSTNESHPPAGAAGERGEGSTPRLQVEAEWRQASGSVEAIERVVARYWNDCRALLTLARQERAVARYDEAFALIDRARALEPRNSRVLERFFDILYIVDGSSIAVEEFDSLPPQLQRRKTLVHEMSYIFEVLGWHLTDWRIHQFAGLPWNRSWRYRLLLIWPLRRFGRSSKDWRIASTPYCQIT
jgi:hypothetical protein